MPKTYYLPKTLLLDLMRAAARAGIHELCYVVFGRGSRIVKLCRVPNRAHDTVGHHIFAARDFDRVRARESLEDLNCLGFLHTHIQFDAYPSKGDIKGYPAGTLIFIYSDDTLQLRAFRIMAGRPGFVEKFVRVTSYEGELS